MEATLLVESAREGTLYIDGVERARISAGTPLAIRVSPGPHAVSLAPADGAERFERITVEAGATLRLTFDFQDAAETGRSPDAGAAVGGDSDDNVGRSTHTLAPASAESALEGPAGIGKDADPGAPSGTMVVRTPEGTYEGDVRHGIPHGTGTMEWDDGAVYRGAWVDGRPHGSGKYRWPDGARYVGQWRDGRRHGVGAMEWADGTYYEGTWQEGHPGGTGFMEWRDGTTYEGELAAGRPDGVGTYTAPDGLRYEGEFAEGRAVGGILTVPSGQQYWATMTPEGEWVRERPL